MSSYHKDRSSTTSTECLAMLEQLLYKKYARTFRPSSTWKCVFGIFLWHLNTDVVKPELIIWPHLVVWNVWVRPPLRGHLRTFSGLSRPGGCSVDVQHHDPRINYLNNIEQCWFYFSPYELTLSTNSYSKYPTFSICWSSAVRPLSSSNSLLAASTTSSPTSTFPAKEWFHRPLPNPVFLRPSRTLSWPVMSTPANSLRF